jgi:hypothetical protein
MWDRIVQDYPLTDRVKDATKRLEDAEQPVPQPDPKELARMKYEEENYKAPGLMARATSWLRSSPDVTHAAKEGAPTMTDPKRTIPASIPLPAATDTQASAAGPGGVSTEVSAQTLNGSSTALDTKPDARSSGGTAATSATNTAQAQVPLPSNRDKDIARMRKKAEKRQAKLAKKKKHQQNTDQQPQGQPASTAGAAGVTNSATQTANQTPSAQ